ncbi:MAG TPA: hypothetical protein VKU61_07450 [Candidatus Binatia bacterium]|nr:hypothetical protein [Candidatus Binatia bacterium]
MRSMWKGLLAVSLLVGAAQGVYAKCGDNAGDEQAVIDARNQVESDCHCATATNHGTFVKCAKGVAISRSSGSSPTLPKNCKGAVIRCAAHSACGKIANGAVTCCLTKNGKTKCKIASTATKCTDKGGHVGGFTMTATSCCSNTHPLTEDSCMASPSGAFLQ